MSLAMKPKSVETLVVWPQDKHTGAKYRRGSRQLTTKNRAENLSRRRSARPSGVAVGEWGAGEEA